MLTGTALSRFRENLLGWFSQHGRDLPWRRSKDPYRIWLSEVMLQQTRVATVIPYYERFLKHFSTVQTLAEAPEHEVLRLWAGLGYYSRARNLQKAARQIVSKHEGHFPNSREEALQIAGIGEYTAAAILSIAYGKRFAVLDGNVARVLARLAAIRGDLRTDRRWRKLQQLGDDLIAPKTPGDWNEAMMELGATICTPRAPQCLLCPVSVFCEARKLGLTESIPAKRKKREKVAVTLAALVLVDTKGQTLLLPPPPPRPEKSQESQEVADLLSRMWHFPTIQVERDAKAELLQFTRKTISARHLIESKLLPLSGVRHTVTYRLITVQAFRMDVKKLPAITRAKKLPLADVSSVAISNLTRKVAHAASARGDRHRVG
jgi:A/G-specific adenine glycosylase